jgi:hypothetical protein
MQEQDIEESLGHGNQMPNLDQKAETQMVQGDFE